MLVWLQQCGVITELAQNEAALSYSLVRCRMACMCWSTEKMLVVGCWSGVLQCQPAPSLLCIPVQQISPHSCLLMVIHFHFSHLPSVTPSVDRYLHGSGEQIRLFPASQPLTSELLLSQPALDSISRGIKHSKVPQATAIREIIVLVFLIVVFEGCISYRASATDKSCSGTCLKANKHDLRRYTSRQWSLLAAQTMDRLALVLTGAVVTSTLPSNLKGLSYLCSLRRYSSPSPLQG